MVDVCGSARTSPGGVQPYPSRRVATTAYDLAAGNQHFGKLRPISSTLMVVGAGNGT
ncbi:MAG: hypothetical protein IKJ80_05060 [Clostridia bacterium]|nr:hypothetical protein [Clostridia bacterium]